MEKTNKTRIKPYIRTNKIYYTVYVDPLHIGFSYYERSFIVKIKQNEELPYFSRYEIIDSEYCRIIVNQL